MTLDANVLARIQEVVQARVRSWAPCAICGQPSTWKYTDGLSAIAVSDDLSLPAGQGPRRMPFITVFCSNCGNTIFLNLLAMGLQDLVAELGNPDKDNG